MEDPPEETEPPHPSPHSLRELHSVSLMISLASSHVERKQILHSFGMTIEEFDELFGHSDGFADPDSD
ncbi:hypothetical protein TNCT6_38820 [Streptomyces sp. 6-11-2]|nr:hypothetical protein TNCT6_38820 [Streptomyces sp. 6-11-2]